MKRILGLLCFALALLVCAPEASAGCGKGLRLPNPFRFLKQRAERRPVAVESCATCATVTLQNVPRESAGIDPTVVLQWAGPMAGNCATGQCGTRRKR